MSAGPRDSLNNMQTKEQVLSQKIDMLNTQDS